MGDCVRCAECRGLGWRNNDDVDDCSFCKGTGKEKNVKKTSTSTKNRDIEDDRKLITRVDDHARNLTEWEIDFLESCCKRVLDEKLELSEKQRTTLERIEKSKVR